MTATAKEKRDVTLPEGVSLRRVAQVLLDAWEADPRHWMNATSELREGASQSTGMPVPQDALDLFRLLAERHVEYLLVGGMAMLTYVKGRNTKDVDLLMSEAALEHLPELKIEEQNELFVRVKFCSIQVDLLLTENPLFEIVAKEFATEHSFAEWNLPTVTVEGMVLLKLYLLPSLYNQKGLEGALIYEADVKMLLARYQPQVEPLFQILEPYVSRTDLTELKQLVCGEQQRIARIRKHFHN